jgi:ABC-type lipoprotein release transport system permease subunit
MESTVLALIGALIGLVIGLVIIALITLFFRWIWNMTMPEVFGIKALSFWQAFRILLLASILFGGGTRVIERGHEVVTADTIGIAAD